MRLAKLLAAASALALWPAVAHASVSTFIGENTAVAATSVSVSTTGTVPSGGKLVIAAMNLGTAGTLSGATGCTVDGAMGNATNGGIAAQVVSYTCASGLASSTSLTLTWSTPGEGDIRAFSLPSTVTTQDKTGGTTGSGNNPNFTTAALAQANEVLIEATGVSNLFPTETPPAGCALLGTPGGEGTVYTLFTTECVITSASAYTFSSSLDGTYSWRTPYSTFLYAPSASGGVPTRSLMGVGR